MKYIIDTDPGIDDAIAISLGILNGLDVIGFTLSNGNIPVEKSENNLKVLEDFLNINIPIYKGSFDKNKSFKSAEFVHGTDGLGYAIFPKSKRVIERMKAEDFIIKASKKYKDDLTLICLGPLTNLANAIKKDKNLTKRLKHIVFMGLSYNPSAKDPYIEFNVSSDVESAKLVFETPFEEIKAITHEVGVLSYIEKDYINFLKESKNLISKFIHLISLKYMEFSYDHYKIKGLCTPDPTTIASVINNDIITFSPVKVKIIDKGKNIGESKVKLTKQSNILISTDFDLEKFRILFKNTFN